MNISCFHGVWFPIWLRPDNGNIAVTHSLRSPASDSANHISLVGLFIIASSDCEWCLANGFSIQICWLDATESQQGLSFLWRQQLQSGVNRREMKLVKSVFMARWILRLVRFLLILKVSRWKGTKRESERKKEGKQEEKKLDYLCLQIKDGRVRPSSHVHMHKSTSKPHILLPAHYFSEETGVRTKKNIMYCPKEKRKRTNQLN